MINPFSRGIKCEICTAPLLLSSVYDKTSTPHRPYIKILEPQFELRLLLMYISACFQSKDPPTLIPQLGNKGKSPFCAYVVLSSSHYNRVVAFVLGIATNTISPISPPSSLLFVEKANGNKIGNKILIGIKFHFVANKQSK